MSNDDHGHDQRARALALSEGELRRRVDVLLEQCGREALTPHHTLPQPIGPFLYISEVLMLLGVGQAPSYDELNEVLGDARAAYDADPEGWIRDHTVGGIRPHIPPRSGQDNQRFAMEFPGYCADGTCGVCGACLLRRDGG